MKRWKRLICVACAMVIAFAGVLCPNGLKNKAYAASSDMRDVSAADIVADMGLGWNLGNSLECIGTYKEFDTNYSLVAFYEDGSNWKWSKSASSELKWKDDNTLTATVSWDMKDILSADNSTPYSIGFEVLNFVDGDVNGTSITANVTKATLKTSQKSYDFPTLLGTKTQQFKDGITYFDIKAFDKSLTKSSQLKEGTFTITVDVTTGKKKPTKEEYFETLRDSPIVTKELIDKIKLAGFYAIRLPVSWYVHMDALGNIDKAWMDRVQTVVNYILDNHMYCIINVHGDTSVKDVGWLGADTSDPSMEEKYTHIWKQIAERFKNYGDYLLFEGFNELLAKDADGNDIWYNPPATALTAVNHLNQLFVDTVRASGGNNADRFLVVNTYAASTRQEIIDGFVLPEDTITNHLIVEVHDYSPTDFTWQQSSVTWAVTRDTWDPVNDQATLDAIFDRLDKRFIQNGIPVIVGEFSSNNKNNTIERQKHANYYVSAAKAKGITCFWWDDGGKFEVASNCIYEGTGLINRKTEQWVYPEIVTSLRQAAYGDIITADKFTVSPIPAQSYAGTACTPPVTVTYDSKELLLNKDYVLTYSNNTVPGKATLTITGIAKYDGTVTLTYNILLGVPVITSVKSSVSKSATVKWNTVSGTTGYEISYATSKNGKYTIAGTVTGVSKTINTLTKGKTYYFKVRAYVTADGKKLYGEYSKAVSTKIK